MTPEEANAKALHRIREAKKTGALELVLSGLALNRLPRKLGHFISLQTLDLSHCEQLSDLSPLAGLTSLQRLDLSWCGQLSDLSPLAGQDTGDFNRFLSDAVNNDERQAGDNPALGGCVIAVLKIR